MLMASTGLARRASEQQVKEITDTMGAMVIEPREPELPIVLVAIIASYSAEVSPLSKDSSFPSNVKEITSEQVSALRFDALFNFFVLKDQLSHGSIREKKEAAFAMMQDTRRARLEVIDAYLKNIENEIWQSLKNWEALAKNKKNATLTLPEWLQDIAQHVTHLDFSIHTRCQDPASLPSQAFQEIIKLMPNLRILKIANKAMNNGVHTIRIS